MVWATVNFGKHSGKTLPQIAFTDPDYILWALNKGVFSGALLAQAKEITDKGQCIKIPGDDGSRKVRYYVDRASGKLAELEIVEADRGPHSGSSTGKDRKYFDLFFAAKQAKYDKSGGKFMIQAIKHHILGNISTKITKARAEELFDNRDYFDMD